MAYNPDKAKTEASSNPEPIDADESAAEFSSNIDQEDLDAWQVPPGFGEDDAPGGEGPEPEVLVGPDEFYDTFRGLLEIPNLLVAPPLRSIDAAVRTREGRRASDSLHAICCDVSWLRWIVSPGGKWAARLVPVSTFALVLAGAIRAELHDRAMRPANPEDEPEPRRPRKPTPTSGYTDEGITTLNVGQPTPADEAEGEAA